MMRRLLLNLTLILMIAVVLVSCSGGSTPDILTTTTILADITRIVVGDQFSVGSLLPTGSDTHSYQPVPQDATKIRESKVLVIHGVGYEAFLQPLLENVGGKQNVIDASKGTRLLSDEQGNDPHLWFDPNNVIIYVDNIREGLTRFDPSGAEVYATNARAYIMRLQELDAWINGQVAQIPPKRRVLVSNHDALRYFADRYGFRVVGAVIPSFSSSSSPSAGQMAELIGQIQLYEVPAIFLDASDNPDLAQQIAAETGVAVVTDLHLESLTEGAPAGTYIEMMRHNVGRMVEALK